MADKSPKKPDSNTDFAKDVRDRWKAAEEADKENRDEALEDLRFAAGEQWDKQVRAYREGTETNQRAFPLPCLTINTLPQFIGQVIGDRRANATSIKVLPRENGDKQIADIRSELIRSIELQSKADRIFAQTFEQAVSCGVGNLRIDLDYAYEDAFDRDLFIRGIANPMAVLWDPLSSDPTGRDAEYCFVSDKMKREAFKTKFPDAKETNLEAAGLKEDGWVEGDNVRISEYWRIDERLRKIGLAVDGQVIDLTELPQNQWPQLYTGPDGKPKIRDAKCKYATMVLTNGEEELSDPFELKLHRIPIIRATGREVWIGDKRVRFGLVRFARDPQRLKNYWRSVVAELLMTAPRDNFIADIKSIEGREGDWPNTLVYNDGTQAPTQVTLANMAAIVNEAQMCAQDMKDTTGIHEASLGMPSNETSGKAIIARQHEGDNASIVYHDNMNAVQQEAGEVLNALIPIVYDTARTVRTVGSDQAVKMVKVNDPMADQHIDLSVGRYDVTISTGVRYETKRQESAAQLMQLAAQDPQLVQVAGDLIIDELDLINGDKIKERVKRAIPANILGDDADDNKTDEEKQADQQKAQEADALQKQGMELEMRLKQAEVDKAEADARKANADADKAESDAIRAKVQGAITGAHLAEAASNLGGEEAIAA